MAKKDLKQYLPVLIPLIAAVLVVSTLAVSGRVASKQTPTKNITAVSQQETTTEPEPQNSKVTIVAVGDNLIHNTCIDAGKQGDGTLDYTSFYEEIKQYIEPADIAVINQETMLGGSSFEYAGFPNFNSPWEIGDAAIAAGFDVFTCATNHSMDLDHYGKAGIEKELEYFSKHPEVVHIGTNASEADYQKITYYEKNGIKFALLNYTYGLNGYSLPKDRPYAVNLLTNKEKVTKDIKEARKNADVVMVFPHWGQEDTHQTNSMQKEYTKLFSQLGVDIVIGTHPHVLQPVEWVKNEETGKKMLVYYSIGNFISHQVRLTQMCGGMAEITVERKDGKIEITNAKLAPVIDYYKNTGSGYKFHVYRLSDYTDELAASQAQDGATVSYFTNLSKEVISEEFLDLT